MGLQSVLRSYWFQIPYISWGLPLSLFTLVNEAWRGKKLVETFNKFIEVYVLILKLLYFVSNSRASLSIYLSKLYWFVTTSIRLSSAAFFLLIVRFFTERISFALALVFFFPKFLNRSSQIGQKDLQIKMYRYSGVWFFAFEWCYIAK